MHKTFLLFLAIWVLGNAVPAFAMTMEEGADAPTRTLEDYIQKYVDVPKGGVDWKIFGATKEISIEGRDQEGLDFQYYQPSFSDELKALDGQEIILKGYMFPLAYEEEQDVFLFGPFPMNCPFQYHVGPSLVIAAETPKNKPIRFSYDPIVLKGKLELIPKDINTGLFYKLHQVTLLPAQK